MNKKFLEVQNVYFDAVNENKSYRSSHVRLLNDISVKFESGKLIAVMGSNGSGKSTLINLIIARVEEESKSSGKIVYNNSEVRDVITWTRDVAFLEQKEVYIRSLCVEDFLRYDIQFYRKDLSSAEQDKLLVDVMTKAGIIHKRFESLAELSGGETKKVMIADILLQDSQIYFMDEPTSWLDSYNAEVFIKNMKGIAKEKNIMIVVIINQPGQKLFELFDDLIFIKPGGNLFYSGPISEVDSFLASKSLIKEEGVPTANYLFSLETAPDDSSIPIEGVTVSNTSSATTYSGLNQTFTGAGFSFTDVSIILKRRISCIFAEEEFNLFFILKLLSCVIFSYVLSTFLDRIDNEFDIEFSRRRGNLNWDENDLLCKKFIVQIFFFFLVMPLFNYVSKFASIGFYNKHDVTPNEIFLGKFSTSSVFISSLIFDTLFRLLTSVLLYSYVTYKKKEYFLDSFWPMSIIMSSLMFSILLHIVISTIKSRYLYILLSTLSYVLFFVLPETAIYPHFVDKEKYASLYDRLLCYIYYSALIFNPTNWLKLIWINDFKKGEAYKLFSTSIRQGMRFNITPLKYIMIENNDDVFESFLNFSCKNYMIYGLYAVQTIIYIIVIYYIFMKMISPTIRLKLQK